MSDISELAKLAAGGDNSAFERLYEQTKSGVWFTCKSLLNNEENARDIMQDTYLAAFERLASLSDFSGVQSWLNKIAANKCKNFIKSKANSALVEDSEEILESIPDDSLIPEEYVADAAKRRIIMEIIEKALSEEQFRTIILYYFDEMTAAEIAELMDVHEKTVLYRLKVARAKIKEAIMRYEEENKDKLHGVVFIPSLTRLFRAEAENTQVPPMSLELSHEIRKSPNTQNVPSEQAAQAAQASKVGGKAMLNTLKAKIIAGACAAAVVGGGVTAGVLIVNGSKDKTEGRPSYSASTNVSKPAAANTSKPAEQSAPADSAANSAAATTSATTSGSMVEGDYEYAPLKHKGKVDDSAVMITKYNGSGGKVTIPSELGGKPVKSISRNTLGAFNRCENVTEVTIPEGVLYIEIGAFRKCTALEKINLPSSLLEIGSSCFEDCESLVTVTLPANLTEIGYEAFKSCESLKTVYLNDNLHILGVRLIKSSDDAEVIYKGQSYNEDTFDELIETYFNGDLYMPG